ncbi:MAG TPA: alpha/beta hydrolase, partial [Hyphomicrobiaceae bacterium]|nr:alpha/beta hydrolase [Hyphomicrobiaceae bacterium]
MDTFDAGPRSGPPAPWLAALEARAPLELAVTLAMMPLLRLAPTGDGHPVLVIPGLATSDMATITLRWYLSDCRYAAH